MDPPRWPLVGRDAACRVLASAMERGRTRSVVIAGPAGVGRTRLAREALALAERAGRPARWAGATSAAALVPLGALAHLLPTIDGGSDPLALLQRTAHAIAGDASGPPPVLGVDDVHLLDPLSVTLLHQLAAAGTVTLVLSVRSGSMAPDPTAPLWKDGLATRVELRPLGRPDTERLLSRVLGGDLETRTGVRLWRLSQGNPLFLRELVEDGVRTGRLQNRGGLWQWEGPMVPSERLAEIVLAQLGGLDATEWRALEVLAAAEPVSVHQVAALSSPEAVAALERRSVVADVAGRSGEVQAQHPLYAEVVRGRAPAAALRFVQHQLAENENGHASDEQLFRRCAAQLDCGEPSPETEVLVAGARAANAALDHPLAERLARAAVDAGGGAAAHLALIEAHRWQGQSGRAAQLAVEAAPAMVTDDDRARLAVSRALTLFCGLGRAEEANAVLRATTSSVRSEEGRAALVAAEAMLAFLGGDPEQAVRQATAVLSSRGGAAARPLAAASAAACLALAGRTEESIAAVQGGWTALLPGGEDIEPAFARIALAQAEVMALHLAGRIHELERRATELQECTLAGPAWAGDAIAALHRGWAALASGRPRLAVRWLVEARGGLQRGDPMGMRHLCWSLLVMARVLAGEIAATRESRDVDGPPHGAIRVFDPPVVLARAWLAGAENQCALAGGLVVDAAALAAERGQPAVEAVILHSALRYGRAPEVASRLRALAQQVDSSFVADLAAHAEAVAARAGEELDAVSHRFETAGALVFAAEAAAEAAAARESSGCRRAAAMSRARAVSLARECDLVDTPALELLSPPTLTSREEEVARLAVGGLSNQDIADRLVLSVRTVEAHLANVYTKFGISGRGDLRTTLTTTRSVGKRRQPFSGLSAEHRGGAR